ncbi:hypothetical protein BDZ97DRAFT_1630101, partial [Flammula alnicola]
IERTPDIYISELRDQLLEARGIEASDATIIRTLKRRGFVRKKVSASAVERNEERRAAEYQIHMAEMYVPEQLVFVDES